jgi:hypothetical protein
LIARHDGRLLGLALSFSTMCAIADARCAARIPRCFA